MSGTVRRWGGALVAAVLVGSVGLAGPAQADSNNNNARKLTKAVTLAGVLRHLVAFQAIADVSGGNRASGTVGYDRSAAYVETLMRLAGYRVTRQSFEFNFCEETSSSAAITSPAGIARDLVDGTDYDLMECSGSGTATGEVVPVDVNLTPPRASTSGCDASDFEGVDVAGKIALLQRGSPPAPAPTCPFGTKVANAEAAGAIGAIVMNQGNGTPEANPDRYSLVLGTLGSPVGIPAIGVPYALGEQLATTPGATVTITAETVSEVRTTSNVIAESRWGDPDNVVMLGAHLDSEPDTAGINDNGSGSAGILEVALQMRKVKTEQKMRFAWWGAEESNLSGSTYYVGNATDEDLARIKLYLNFDMIGSPNYVFGVYDGDDSDATGSPAGPPGSPEIEGVFQAFFAGRGLPTNGADFTGRSDYGPFIAAGVGIPAGGLFTGAEVLKTPADVAKYGGVAGEQYDPCYHDPCDSLRPLRDGGDPEVYAQLEEEYDLFGNVNKFAIDTNADAIATAAITFAFDLSMIPPRAAPATTLRAAGPPAPRSTAEGHLLD